MLAHRKNLDSGLKQCKMWEMMLSTSSSQIMVFLPMKELAGVNFALAGVGLEQVP